MVANIKLNDLDNPMTTRPEYGSREFYAEMFSDIISDTGCYETVEENYETVMKIMGGFQDAIESWLNYHRVAAESFEDLRDEYLGFSFSSVKPEEFQELKDKLEAEESELPEIPSFPSLIQ